MVLRIARKVTVGEFLILETAGPICDNGFISRLNRCMQIDMKYLVIGFLEDH
jgi:hypothetical protein